MKKFFMFAALLFVAGCTSSRMITYNAEDGKYWNVKVEKSGAFSNFEVIIDDSTVIDQSPNYFNQNLNATGNYKGKLIRLMVNKSTDLLGLGNHYNASLFIDDRLYGNFEF